MSTITVEQRDRIAEWLEEHPVLAVGSTIIGMPYKKVKEV